VLGLEEVADHAAASAEIGIDPDEAHAAVIGFDLRLGQRGADAARIAVTGMGVEPHGFLRRMIVADGEGHQLIERHRALAVDFDQRRTDAGELEPLAHESCRDAEPGGDILDPHSLINKRLERCELVGGMHREPHDVLGEADLSGVGVIDHMARHRKILGELLFPAQQRHGRKPPTSGDDFELALGCRANLKVLQQAVGGDAGGEFVNRQTRIGLADIGLARHELVEGDHLNGHGFSPWG